MSEKLATPPQIRKLYAVLRNSGIEPEEYVEKLKEKKGLNSLNEARRTEISKLIDLFETYPNDKSVVDAFNEDTGNNKEDKENKEGVVVSEEDKDRLNEIDAVFRECVARADKLVSNKLAGTEPPQATIILEIAKLYFKELRKGRAERG